MLDRPTNQPMPDHRDPIPYSALAREVLPTSDLGKQRFVPFLGAGVSISARDFPPPPTLDSPPPTRAQLDQATSLLDLTGKSKTFVEMAILLAYLMQLVEAQSPVESAPEFFERLRTQEYPPSASELAQLFSEEASYTSLFGIGEKLRKLVPQTLFNSSDDEQLHILQLLVKATRVGDPPEALTSISSYYEKRLGRKSLWQLMKEVISTKAIPTDTHKLFACAAKHHLKGRSAKDYLIITTNYDCLMEKALDEEGVPYIVLTTKRSDPPKVLIRCSENVVERDDLKRDYWDTLVPKEFFLSKAQSLVVIYKIHGCLNPQLEFGDEGLVISDNDYVNYVSQMSNGIIPATVSELMRLKPLWFLGYSLSDWNVRSIYETVKRKSDPNNEIRDCAVTYSVGNFERLFFDKNGITIYEASLNDFASKIISNKPQGVDLGDCH